MKKLMTAILALSFLGATAMVAQVPAAKTEKSDTAKKPAKKAKKDTAEKKADTAKKPAKKAKKSDTEQVALCALQMYVAGKPRSARSLRGNPV